MCIAAVKQFPTDIQLFDIFNFRTEKFNAFQEEHYFQLVQKKYEENVRLCTAFEIYKTEDFDQNLENEYYKSFEIYRALGGTPFNLLGEQQVVEKMTEMYLDFAPSKQGRVMMSDERLRNPYSLETCPVDMPVSTSDHGSVEPIYATFAKNSFTHLFDETNSELVKI